MKIDVYHIGWERMDIGSTAEYWLNRFGEVLGEGHDYGIYQLYGVHPVYGNDVLLYIGKTQKQRFAQCLKQYAEKWYEREGLSRLHVGRVYNLEDGHGENWGEVIDNVKKLLIYAHAPALNEKLVNNRPTKDENEHFIVRNWGDYGSIQQELSTLVHSDHYYDEDKFSFEYLSEDE